MTNLTKMSRWVERRGKHVEFGNVVGPFCGKPYKYRCATFEGAQQFANYVAGMDSTGMPVSVGEDIAARYGAVSLDNLKGGVAA